MQNPKGRDTEGYAVTERRSEVSWASQNMLVLGIIIFLGLMFHLLNFWYNTVFAELVGMEGLAHGQADGSLRSRKPSFSPFTYCSMSHQWQDPP